jgi:hypothetical protein
LISEKQDTDVEAIANLLKICKNEKELHNMDKIIRACLNILNNEA